VLECSGTIIYKGFKGTKKDNFQKKFGAGGINSFSRLGEPYKQCPNLTAGALICGAGGINSFSRLGEPYKQCPLHTQSIHYYFLNTFARKTCMCF